MILTKKVKFHESCIVEVMEYKQGGVALQLITEEGEPMATATIHMGRLAEGEVAIKDYSENYGVLKALVDAEIIDAPHRHIEHGFVNVPVCMLSQATKNEIDEVLKLEKEHL